ncbi:ABC transporter permease [Streptosporangium vulgare]|uniref:ABC transporter permease n=1 Tax=Streptosporangium vulgare TaxID=46190 RepID=UPI0031D496CE
MESVRAPGRGLLPDLWRASAARSSVELKSFFRNRQSLVFTLFFPVILLVVFGAIFTGKVQGTETDFRQVFMAGIVAAGVMSTAFSGLAINIAIERDTGLISRLAMTPMPKSAYFIGKLVKVVVTTVVEMALLLGIAVTAFGLPLPSTAQRWFTPRLGADAGHRHVRADRDRPTARRSPTAVPPRRS